MRQIILLTLIAFTITSCSKKDSDLDTSPLEGEWNVDDVSCFCAPFDIETGDHIWAFNITDNELKVENIANKYESILLETGTYEINVSENTIVVEGVEYAYSFEDDKLYLDSGSDIVSDSPKIELIKN